MHRRIAAGLFVAAAAASPALAQTDSGRVALGAQIGTSGVGAEVQFKVSDLLTLRAGGDSLKLDEQFSSDDIDYDGEADFSTASAFVDLHPFRNGLLISGGGYFGGRSVSLDATSTVNAEIGNVVFTPAQIGTITGEADFGDAAPFLGLGFNNAFTTGGRIGFKLVAGAIFGEEPSVNLRRSSGVALPAAVQTQLDGELRNEEREVEADLEDFKTYPVVQVGLSYRF